MIILSEFSMLINVISKPRNAFSSINKTYIAFYLFFVPLFITGLLAINISRYKSYAYSVIVSINSHLSPEQINRMTSDKMLLIGIFLTAISPLVIWSIEALIFVTVGYLANVRVNFKKAYYVAAVSWAPILIGYLFKNMFIFLIDINNLSRIQTSMALFLPERIGFNNVLYVISTKLDFFTIWSLYLLITGITISVGFPYRLSMAMVSGMYMVSLLITAVSFEIFK